MWDEISMIRCQLCGREMPYSISPMRFYCSGKCRTAANRAIKSGLYPGSYASHHIQKALLPFAGINREELAVGFMAREEVLHLLWSEEILEQLNTVLDECRAGYNAEYLIQNWESIYAEELPNLDARIYSRLQELG